MSEPFDTTPDYEEVAAEAGSDEEAFAEEPPGPGRRKRPLWVRVLRGIGIALLVLVAVAVLLYNYGSMWTPSAEVRQAYAQGVEQGIVPPIEKEFHIPIPGCVCHSSDPVLQMQHESRHIKDCMNPGCHG